MGTDIADDQSDPRTQLYLQLSGNTARPHPAQPHPPGSALMAGHGEPPTMHDYFLCLIFGSLTLHCV